MQHNVIVGAGAAGISAAIGMRSHGYDGLITVIDRDPHEPYERPPLSKLGDRTLRPIVSAEQLKHLDLDLRLGVGVTDANPIDRTLALGDGTSVIASNLLLTTGVAARRMNVAGADLDHVLVLRDAADAGRLADRLAAGGPFVVVGGGFIGLEIAAVARDHGLDVTVVEISDRPLPSLHEEIGRRARLLHEENGVQFVLGRSVRRIAGSTHVTHVDLDDDTRIPAATVVVGIGVEPRTELARTLGVETDRHGIVVDPFGRTNVPWVYAAGDVASQPHPHLVDGRARIEHWDVALKHGAAVGATMVGQANALTEPPYVWSDQFGLTFQMFGRPCADDEFILRPDATPRSYLGFWLRDNTVVAICGLDRARDVATARRLLQRPAGAHRPDLADDATDLKTLIKTMNRS
ncbi:FAD-dependent oxidoreductase [Nocardioides sp. AN3]